MITSEKLPNALYALNGILIKARFMAYNGEDGKGLGELLDAAEMLPRFIASREDETEKFRQYVTDIAKRHKCEIALQRFDEPIPEIW